MDWDALIGGLMSSPLLLLAVAVIGKIWPDSLTAFSTWLYSHVDPERLPYGSEMNAHWAQSRELGERLDRFEATQHEVQKDTIKNTLINLMADTVRDHSEAVRYELDKLKRLNADCWIVDAAERYLINHQTNINQANQEGESM